MSIPKWRYYADDDDGCNVYQCLFCYETWNGRSSPRYWKFCPCCGVKWSGELEWDTNKEARRHYKRELSYLVMLEECHLFKRENGSYEPLESISRSSTDGWTWLYNMPNHVYEHEVLGPLWKEITYRGNLKWRNDYVLIRNFGKAMLEYPEVFLMFSDGFRLRIKIERRYGFSKGKDDPKDIIIPLGEYLRKTA